MKELPRSHFHWSESLKFSLGIYNNIGVICLIQQTVRVRDCCWLFGFHEKFDNIKPQAVIVFYLYLINVTYTAQATERGCGGGALLILCVGFVKVKQIFQFTLYFNLSFACTELHYRHFLSFGKMYDSFNVNAFFVCVAVLSLSLFELHRKFEREWQESDYALPGSVSTLSVVRRCCINVRSNYNIRWKIVEIKTTMIPPKKSNAVLFLCNKSEKQ